MAPVTSTETVTDTEIAAGGKPNPGTKKDKRLQENAATVESPEEALAEVDAAPKGAPFLALLCVEGLETSDHRMFELGSTTWRNPPLPFMVQDTSPHGPGQQPAPAWAAGQFDEVYRDPADPSRIMASGHLMDNEAGHRAEELIRGAMRGLSVDAYSTSPLPPGLQPRAVNEDGEPVEVLIRYADSEVSRATLVPTPAFAAACVWMADEEMPQAAADAHGTIIAADTEPEVVKMPTNGFEMLVASGGGPVNPPKAFFFQPEPNHRQEIILDPTTGMLTGHLFGDKECHIAYAGTCEMAPRSRTNPPFVGFHRTEAHCDDGDGNLVKVACGWIPIGTDHSKLRANGHRDAESWTQEQTWDHYENSGSLIAKVRASNGKHGVWLSGCLLPGLSDRELAIAQGLSVSGHWNLFTDPRDQRRYPDELLGILGGVPTPGYPETRVRPELLVASGQVVGHITPFSSESLDDDCTDCPPEGAPMTVIDPARFARLEKVVSALCDAAPADVKDAVYALMAEPETTAAVEPIVESLVIDVGDAQALVEDILDWAALAETPLTTVELARYLAKYDRVARSAMALAGEAMPTGTNAILDEEDLRFAIRKAASTGERAHATKRAEALSLTHLIPTSWAK